MASLLEMRLEVSLLHSLAAARMVGALSDVFGAVEVQVVMQDASLHLVLALFAVDEDPFALLLEVVSQSPLRHLLAAVGARDREVFTVWDVLCQE